MHKVIILGAGIAGVAASILISHKVANLSYTVYERQDAVVCTLPDLSTDSMRNGLILRQWCLGWNLGSEPLSRCEV